MMSQNDIFLCFSLDTNDHELPVKIFMNTFAELPWCQMLHHYL